MRELVDLIEEEDDLDKFAALVAELNRLLDGRKPPVTRSAVESGKDKAQIPIR